jgi:hypothetical protein
MSTAITAVQGTSKLVNAEFIRLTIQGGPDGGVYTFSSSYKIESFTDPVTGDTIIGNPGTTATNALSTFTPLGGLVGVSGHQRDLSVTSFDTSVTIQGIDPDKLGLVIDAKIKGSRIEIWRGFYDANMNLSSVSKRYTGIVTGYNLTEDRVQEVDTFSLDLHCSSYKRVLENRHAGRFTNSQSWNGTATQYLSDGVTLNPAYDASMDGVAALNGATFNFGVKLA